MIGPDCLVTGVTKGSDAERVGIETGDKIIKVGDIEPERSNLWKLLYILYSLAPTRSLELTFKKENAPAKTLTVNATTIAHKDYIQQRKKRKDQQVAEKCTEIN